MQRTDEQLVTAYVRQGDERAFRELVERHQERVFGFLVGMVRDADVANDLFQDTFMRVIRALHRKRGSYEDQGRFGAWVLRIARNAALDHLRRRRKWHAESNGSRDEGFEWEALADERPDALERVESDEQNRWL